jgi:hypothetical protein
LVIQNLKGKLENTVTMNMTDKDKAKELQSKLDNSENIRNELETKLLTVPSTEVSSIKDIEIEKLKEINGNLQYEVTSLTTRLTTITALHTERSRNEEIARKKIIEITNEFGIRKTQLVKQIVNKVFVYRDALNEAVSIQETLIVSEGKALDYEKLYTASKNQEDLRNQRILENEAKENNKKLTIILKRVGICLRLWIPMY